MFRTALAVAISMGSLGAHAQTLCDVSSVQRGEQGAVLAILAGKRDLSISVEGERSRFMESKGGTLRDAGKAVPGLQLRQRERAHMTEGLNKFCNVVVEERDGVLGVYIEEASYMRGQPPYLRSEFVEVN